MTRAFAPDAFANASVRSAVPRAVRGLSTSSTSGIRLTGLKKCSPIVRPGSAAVCPPAPRSAAPTGIRRQHTVRTAARPSPARQRGACFAATFSTDRLGHEVAVAKSVPRRGGLHARQPRRRGLGLHLFPRHRLVEHAADHRQAALDELRLHVAQHDVVPAHAAHHCAIPEPMYARAHHADFLKKARVPPVMRQWTETRRQPRASSPRPSGRKRR